VFDGTPTVRKDDRSVNFARLENRIMRRHHALEDIPTRLWHMVALARHRLLMLDYDGTLAPFTVAREEARAPRRTLELLERIARSTHTTLAIVTGRPLLELERLVGDLPAIVVGEHGWERRAPDGSIVRRALAPAVAAKLEAADRAARDCGWGELLERKRSGVVLHTRALPGARARELEASCMHEWQPLAVAGVALDHIDGGVELRARERNKGTVVLSLLSQAAPGTLGVFVGDDVTDEDAFEAVSEWGFGVRVGDVHEPSIAQGRLASSDAVGAFLEAWLETCMTRDRTAQ
jgi:trehalose-phosphatase